MHRAVARETRHVQRRHLGVARTSHDTRYELLADAAATPSLGSTLKAASTAVLVTSWSGIFLRCSTPRKF